jgi:PAS domain S-box-containing protein
VLETSLDPLAMVSLQGKLSDVNEAAVKVTGVPRNKLIGSEFASYFTEPEKARQAYETVLKEGSIIDSPLTIHSTSGDLTDVLVNASIYKGEQGKVLGVLVAARDNTRAKQALKNAEESNKELEAFSYTVSHDLRAPLRSIDGFSEMLGKDYGDKIGDDGQRLIGTIRASAEQMGRLIDDLLSFSRLSRQEMKLQEVDMKALAQTVYDELKINLAGRNIEFKLGELPGAMGDPSLLHEVWANLISNAIKFTKFRNVATVKIDAKQDNSQTIYFVTDNGAGFDMKYVDKLFGVFQRLHSAEEFEGTGIGLSIVKRIILRHKGKVWIESKLNEGTTFYFALPTHEGVKENGK